MMQTRTLHASASPPARQRPRWRSLLPVEHGSWSLAGEPVALGLIAAPSMAGAALAVATIAAFLARRPLVLARGAGGTRGIARRALVFLAVAGLAAFAVAGAIGPWRAMMALLAGAPAAVLFLFFDAQREARAEAAEVSGVLAFAVVPVAMALLGGWSWPLAAALGLTSASRSLPVVLTVRAYLRSSRGDPSGRLRAIAATLALAVANVSLAAWWRFPWIVAALAVLQLVRVVVLLGPRAPRLAARRLGLVEAIAGAVHVLLAALAWRLVL